MDYSCGYMPHTEGNHNSAQGYTPMAIVYDAGKSYISKVEVPTGVAVTNTNYWQPFAEGTQGTAGQNGSQGAAGQNGTNGTNGIQGATGAQGARGASGTTNAWAIDNIVAIAGGNVVIDKPKGGIYYIANGNVGSLKLTNVDSSIKTRPCWIQFTAGSNFQLNAADLTAEFKFATNPIIKANYTYVLMLVNGCVYVNEMRVI